MLYFYFLKPNEPNINEPSINEPSVETSSFQSYYAARENLSEEIIVVYVNCV